ncbi:hypothetical protein [Oceanobacillus halotolerans]|uniref:hypothetical protein n=1 Tax=Oceanobacillus halotolerans TaxID=2663380 RepID=UPI0013D9CE7A|nr:hypothetical protein [Oceanobacillus halotolerans]
MKKNWFTFLAIALVVLTACGATDEEDSKETENEEEATEQQKDGETNDDGNMEVDKDLLNVEVTLPASLFEGEDMESSIEEAKENGVSDVTQNEDGSVTYKMSKSVHKDMMEEIKADLGKSVEEMKNNEDYISIQDITYNNSFSEFTLEVDREAYENSMDGFAAFGLGFSGMYYQIFDGTDPDDTNVTIYVKDYETQEVFDELIYPDEFEEE